MRCQARAILLISDSIANYNELARSLRASASWESRPGFPDAPSFGTINEGVTSRRILVPVILPVAEVNAVWLPGD